MNTKTARFIANKYRKKNKTKTGITTDIKKRNGIVFLLGTKKAYRLTLLCKFFNSHTDIKKANIDITQTLQAQVRHSIDTFKNSFISKMKVELARCFHS